MNKKYSEPYNISLSMMHSPDSIPLYLDENHPNFSKCIKIGIEAWLHFYGNVQANHLKKKISYEELLPWIIKNDYGWLTAEEVDAILCVITPNWGQSEEDE